MSDCGCHPQVHLAWIKTPRNKGGLGHIKIPILADVKKVSLCSHLHTPLPLIASRRPWHPATALLMLVLTR